MLETIDLIKSITYEIIPGIVSVFIISFIVFLLILFISFKTKGIIRCVKWLWYVQAAVILTAVLGAKSIALSAVPLDAASQDLIDKTSQTLLWLLCAFLLNQALELFVWEGTFLRKYKTTPPGLLVGLVSGGVYLVAAYGILTFTFERPMTGLIVSSGIVAGVLGLAMQNPLSDLVAGVAIGIERPFKIGDWLELDDGTLGEVVDINWRATHIQSLHSSLYILPNARISNARVHNYNRPDKRYGYWFYVHVPSTVPPVLVRRVLLQAAVESEKVLDEPAPAIRVSEASGSFKYMVFVHFESYPSYFVGMDDILMHIWVQCARHGIVPSAVTSEMIIRRGVAEEIKGPSPDELLARVRLFSELDEESRRTLVGRMKVHSPPMGTDIVCQGIEGTSLFVISAGMVRVMIDIPSKGTEEVAKLGEGEYFGEMSLLANEPRAATVVAHTDCQLLEIDKDALKPVFDKHPELMETMARIVTERRLSNETLEQELSEEDFITKLNVLAVNLVRRMKKVFS